MSQGTCRPERLLFQRDVEARASPDCAGVARQNGLGSMAAEQQNFLERIVSRDFIDQRIEKRPAPNIQHSTSVWFGRCRVARQSPDQNDGLPQHGAPSTKLQGSGPKCGVKAEHWLQPWYRLPDGSDGFQPIARNLDG